MGINGNKGVGYDATLLPQVAEVYLQFRDAELERKGEVPARYAKMILAADTLIRGLANVGIIALIDEVTGYQYDRPRRDLEEQPKEFLSESLRRWVRTFPAEYLRQLRTF